MIRRTNTNTKTKTDSIPVVVSSAHMETSNEPQHAKLVHTASSRVGRRVEFTAAQVFVPSLCLKNLNVFLLVKEKM
jgi:hypothetical protein